MSSDFPAIDAWTEWFERYREELSDAALVHVGALRHAFVSGWLDGRNRLLLQLGENERDGLDERDQLQVGGCGLGCSPAKVRLGMCDVLDEHGRARAKKGGGDVDD